jgi:hypothetical protein
VTFDISKKGRDDMGKVTETKTYNPGDPGYEELNGLMDSVFGDDNKPEEAVKLTNYEAFRILVNESTPEELAGLIFDEILGGIFVPGLIDLSDLKEKFIAMAYREAEITEEDFNDGHDKNRKVEGQKEEVKREFRLVVPNDGDGESTRSDG